MFDTHNRETEYNHPTISSHRIIQTYNHQAVA